MTVKTQPEWATDLIELLEQQRGIYEQLHQLSGKQSELVDGGDAEALLALLAQRQTLIDQLTQINGRIEPYKRDWPTLWPQLDEQTQSRVQGLIDQVQSLLERIVEQDERDRETLSAQRDRIGAQIQRARTGSAVNRAYGGASGYGASSEPGYTDRQG